MLKSCIRIFIQKESNQPSKTEKLNIVLQVVVGKAAKSIRTVERNIGKAQSTVLSLLKGTITTIKPLFLNLEFTGDKMVM